jgi:hypothetical protein
MSRLKVVDEKDQELVESLHKARGCRGVADWLAERTGWVVSEAATTESCYVGSPSICGRVRISGHSSYGSKQPCHVQPFGAAYKVLFDLRRAVVAAVHNFRSYKQFRDLMTERKRAAGLEKWADDEPFMREIAGF